jgi:site-specific DNA-cytosine methylase
MKVLVACEESQVVCKAFRAKGHEAYSCDIIPCSGGHPEWHIQDDVMNLLDYHRWDILIAHPPCDHIAVSGARWFDEKRKDGRQKKAIEFFMKFTNCNIHSVAIENPVGIMSTLYRKPDQIIQPWQFGHGETKSTCLWLKNLPKLQPINIVEGREHRIHIMPPSDHRAKDRARTYQGIADAMADQWGGELRQQAGEP